MNIPSFALSEDLNFVLILLRFGSVWVVLLSFCSQKHFFFVFEAKDSVAQTFSLIRRECNLGYDLHNETLVALSTM